MNCDFCKKEFSSKGNLNLHQKTAKYCLELQGKDVTILKCEFCLKSFTCNKNLNEHLQTCKEKKKKEYTKDFVTKIKRLKEENRKNMKKIDDLQNENKKKLLTLSEEKDSYYTQKLDEKDKYIFKLEETIKNKDKSIMEIAIARFNVDTEISPELIINNITVSSREDGYVNATQLCHAGKKNVNEWYDLESTKELIKVLETELGIPVLEKGTWIHPDLAIHLSQWISLSFGLQVSKWLRGSLKALKDKDNELKQKDTRIKLLENKCLGKQKRTDYPEKNVIYLLTTQDHLQRRTYILGKAKDLKNRLSTYNKTCDHTVVHYRECKTESDMSVAEILIMNKLGDYREQANRERFILPEDKDVSLFISEIDHNINFINSKYNKE